MRFNEEKRKVEERLRTIILSHILMCLFSQPINASEVQRIFLHASQMVKAPEENSVVSREKIDPSGTECRTRFAFVEYR